MGRYSSVVTRRAPALKATASAQGDVDPITSTERPVTLRNARPAASLEKGSPAEPAALPNRSCSRPLEAAPASSSIRPRGHTPDDPSGPGLAPESRLAVVTGVGSMWRSTKCQCRSRARPPMVKSRARGQGGRAGGGHSCGPSSLSSVESAHTSAQLTRFETPDHGEPLNGSSKGRWSTPRSQTSPNLAHALTNEARRAA
mmetsp:Transcript_30684/g.68809  ORF Transcript_30684/g.68809 Transcript_30684/m.68809 type:complete len:200 (+) Transcript_30684:352-951(+)